MMFKVNPKFYIMGIVIAIYIREIYYPYWVRLGIILCGHAIDNP